MTIIEKQDCAFYRAGECIACKEVCRYSTIESKPQNIFELFAKAKQTLKWPALHLKIDDKQIKISPSHDLQVLFISNGKRQFSGRITYGYIRPKFEEGCNKIIGATVKWEKEALNVGGLRILTPALLKDPVSFCSLHGLEFKFCCFCGAELTAKESTFAGYGPICAEKWGLPWGETEKAVEVKDL